MLTRLLTKDVDLRLNPDARGAVIDVGPGQLDLVLIYLVANAPEAIPQERTLNITTGIATTEDNFVTRHYQENSGECVKGTVTWTFNGIRYYQAARRDYRGRFKTGKGSSLGIISLVIPTGQE